MNGRARRFRFTGIVLVLGLLLLLGWMGFLRRRGGFPQILFAGYTNSRATLDRFVILPANTRVAIFCLTNPGPEKFVLRGDVIRDLRTNSAAALSSTVYHTYISDGWLNPGGVEWILFPEPAGVTEWRLAAPIFHPEAPWPPLLQKILSAVGLEKFVVSFRERSPQSEWLHPGLVTNRAVRSNAAP